MIYTMFKHGEKTEAPSMWEAGIKPMQRLIMKPIIFNDLAITLVDALPAWHGTDWIVDEHRHPWFEFNFVSEGAFYTVMEGCGFRTESNESLIIPPGAYHSNSHCNNTGDDGFCLRWKLEAAVTESHGYAASAIAGDIIRSLSVIRPASFKSSARELVESAACMTESLLQAQFAAWILSLNELWCKDHTEKIQENDRDEVLVRQALLYLTEYFASDLSVKDVADSLNISYRHLARIFKQVTGFTMIKKLNDIRVNHAKTLLVETDKTICEIALEAGFNNEFYFANIFKLYTFSSPSIFRKNQKKL